MLIVCSVFALRYNLQVYYVIIYCCCYCCCCWPRVMYRTNVHALKITPREAPAVTAVARREEQRYCWWAARGGGKTTRPSSHGRRLVSCPLEYYYYYYYARKTRSTVRVFYLDNIITYIMVLCRCLLDIILRYSIIYCDKIILYIGNSYIYIVSNNITMHVT